ncbi:leader peptidase (prepilin peptidase) / N-methyltransferase [Frankineae bacterium MT45]|nr:leader peptidase (prepilin peptidase) / N-methyltransferase [Frankineae bacterium MT45]
MIAAATVVAAICGGALSPYLARLTVSVPDREDHRWWRPAAVGGRRYLATAAVAVALTALAGAGAALTALFPALIFLALVHTPLVVIDFETKRLPNRLVFPAAIGGALLFGLAALVDGDSSALLRTFEAAALVYAIFFAVIMISPRSFGFGDVKLLGVLAGMLGWFGWREVYYGVLAGFLLGSVVALGRLLTRRATMKSTIPLGPSLIFGAFLVTGLHRVL